jgi:hypothetical protein
MPSCDGFSFSVNPLYKVVAGHEWYIQVLYVIGSPDGRMRRDATIISGNSFIKQRRPRSANPVLDEKIFNTDYSIGRNGTNMHFLQIGKNLNFKIIFET